MRMARRCRYLIQACLREEEWRDCDREFYLVLREELERFVEPSGRRPAQAADMNEALSGIG